MRKVYVVTADRVVFVREKGKHVEKRVASRGRLTVSVDEAVIKMRGEKVAVLNAAWYKLLGQNSLGEDTNKKIPTRQQLREEINSRHGGASEAFSMFVDRARFTWVANEY